MKNSNCGFTVEKGLKYLKCCGILDECARDCFDTFKYEIDYKKVETLFSFLCLSGDETAIMKLKEWCLKDNSVYWNEFLRNEGKD